MERGKRGPFAGGRVFWPGLAWLPVTFLLVAVATLLVNYAWSVIRNDIYPVFPFVSDVGAQQPERSLFGLGVNVISAQMWCIVFVRSVQLKAYHEDQAVLNKWSYRFGCLAAFGLLLVANFQDDEDHVRAVHFVGAALSFGSFLVYCWVQTVISRRISGVAGVEELGIAPSSAKMAKARFGLSVLATILIVMLLLFLSLSLGQLPSWNKLPEGCLRDRHKGTVNNSSHPWEGDWEPCAAGYRFHLVAAFSEWLLCFSYCAFIVTFYQEFSRLEISCHPQLAGHAYEAISTSTVNHVF